MTKGESMRDTLLTVSAMGVDAVIIRDSSEGAALFASKVMSPKVKVPVVINAGDGAHAHPTQALLELFTFSTPALREVIFTGLRSWALKYILWDRALWFLRNSSQWESSLMTTLKMH